MKLQNKSSGSLIGKGLLVNIKAFMYILEGREGKKILFQKDLPKDLSHQKLAKVYFQLYQVVQSCPCYKLYALAK